MIIRLIDIKFYVFQFKQSIIKHLWKLGLLSSNVLGCPANPLLHADVTSAADFTKESGPETNFINYQYFFFN
jgi:hypothetical protein